MPLLASFLGGLFAGLAEFFAKWLAKKTAFAAAAIATFAVLTVALYAAVQGLVSGLLVAFPSMPGLTTGVWLFVPDNGPACVAAALACDAAVALYHWNVSNLKLAATVS